MSGAAVGPGGPTPLFLPSAAGRFFAVYTAPDPDRDRGRDLVFVPPFAEEVNLSRHTVGRLARSLAAAGIGAFVLDLYGTGDSDGDFGDARWEVWREDVRTAAEWLGHRGRRDVVLCGLRLGALLAAEMAEQLAPACLVLWQPVSGPATLTAFLRVGGAARLAEGVTLGAAVKSLRDRLAAGEAVDIAGYRLAPALAEALAEGDLIPALGGWTGAVTWFDVRAQERQEMAPATERVIAAWRTRGVRTEVVPVVEPAFWSIPSYEPLWADGLVAATVERLTVAAP